MTFFANFSVTDFQMCLYVVYYYLNDQFFFMTLIMNIQYLRCVDSGIADTNKLIVCN